MKQQNEKGNKKYQTIKLWLLEFTCLLNSKFKKKCFALL